MKAIHPGEHLAEELREMGMSAAELSRQLKVPTMGMGVGRSPATRLYV